MIDKPKRGLVDEPGSYAGAKGKGIQLTAAEIKSNFNQLRGRFGL
jgi:hypothetical protein